MPKLRLSERLRSLKLLKKLAWKRKLNLKLWKKSKPTSLLKKPLLKNPPERKLQELLK